MKGTKFGAPPGTSLLFSPFFLVLSIWINGDNRCGKELLRPFAAPQSSCCVRFLIVCGGLSWWMVALLRTGCGVGCCCYYRSSVSWFSGQVVLLPVPIRSGSASQNVSNFEAMPALTHFKFELHNKAVTEKINALPIYQKRTHARMHPGC